ncbi:MAG TPA: gamma-glutamylcyclotransferase [Burkholderiales bacterium]|nr:gamma-glutamylcyclotransferase [Burkholderiales bacterium]
MSLTRDDLKNDRLRRLWTECGALPHPLSDAELEASISRALSGAGQGQDVWVFGYGSLMWNPLFHYSEQRPATLRGFHRRFCLWSITSRGTRERPGLVLGLDRGGSCQGVAYRLPADHAPHELKLLWNREMVLGSYEPRWARVEAAPAAESHGCAQELRALVFTANREHPNYAGKLPLDAVVAALVAASGHLGSSAEYLFRAVDALAAHGLRDSHLETLRRRVEQAAGPP